MTDKTIVETDKMTNNNLQNTTQKTTDSPTRAPEGYNLMFQ